MAPLRAALLPLLLAGPSRALLSGHGSGRSALDLAKPSRAELQCRAACGCRANLTFVANTEVARELYVGCKSLPAQRGPRFLAIGTQKSGTTSLLHGLVKSRGGHFCGPSPAVWPGEAHYFDDPKWLRRGPNAASLKKDYLSLWEHCGKMNEDWMEKSPGYLWSPAAALRVCEALPDTQLFVLLREPVARAYSSFWKGHFGKISNTPQGFHQLVSVDVAIAQECGGMPSGDPQQDVDAIPSFRQCCDRVAKGFNLVDWPGCRCEVPEETPHVCTPLGHKDFAVVRMGVYAPQIRNWLRYHRASDLLVLFSEDFFRDMPGSLCELHCKLGPVGSKQSCSSEPVVYKEFHFNSWRKHHPAMLPETERLLREFYQPHNEDLYQLLGRRAPWK